MRIDRAELAAIFAGGFAGAVLRALVGEWLPHDPGAWPWATFAVNVAGALLLGWFAAMPRRRPLLTTGFCGALTTFSTLQVELLRMLDDGHGALALAYASASIAAGLLAVAAGSRVPARA